MIDLHFPWLEVSILTALVGALVVSWARDADTARKWSVVVSSIVFALAVGVFIDYEMLDYGHRKAISADDNFHLLGQLVGHEILVVDEISAPLLPLAALLYLLTTVATVKTKIRRFSFVWTLLSEAILLTTFSSREPWLLITFMSLGTIPPLFELKARNRPVRVYILHMTLFIGLMVIGWIMVEQERMNGQAPSAMATLPLLVAVLIRSGVAPFHCWITDLFEHATFGTALLYVVPLVGAYGAVRLVLPVATPEVLKSLAYVSLITAVYAGGMALVQKEGRRFFCYLFLSQASLILVGLETVEPIPLAGALCMWISAGIALGGFGLTMRALEARRGRLSLQNYQGLYDHTPALAIAFALTGFASVGFPGTFGFVGGEILIDGVVESYPFIVGLAVIAATTLNGIAVVQTYFLLFAGKRYTSSILLGISSRERFALLTLTGLILAAGMLPQLHVRSRSKAAAQIIESRGESAPAEHEEHHTWLSDPAVRPIALQP